MTARSRSPINIVGFISLEIRARTFKLNSLNNNFYLLSESLKWGRERRLERAGMQYEKRSNVLLAHDSRSSAQVPRRAWPTLRSR